MGLIIDVNVDVTSHLGALKSNTPPVEGVIGYLNPLGQTSKVVTPARARAIGAAGLSLALVSEGWGDFAHAGVSASAGVRDAKNALEAIKSLGVPSGFRPGVAFAVDTDASASQIANLVLPYLRAIKETAGDALWLGVYGSGAICNAALASALVDWTWLAQSTGWLGSKEFAASGKWTVKQDRETKIAGVDCDPNEVKGNYGAWVPFAAAPAGMVSVAQPKIAPQPVPEISVEQARLSAASGAISGMLLNGIHKYTDLVPGMQVIIPTGAVESISLALASAALAAADKIGGSK